MFSTSRSARHLLVSLFLTGLCASPGHARPNGFAVACGGCHYGQLEGGGMADVPTLAASASASRVEPGQPVDITVTVESNWADAVVAGFLVMTQEGGGVFASSEEGVGNAGTTDGQPLDYAIGHTAARPLVAGAATFQATWTAPMTPGAYTFAVYAVTSDDGDGQDDPEVAEESNEPFSKFEFTVAVGCELRPFYRDADMDGFGQVERLSCDAPAGYVAEGGDCKDDNPDINPGAEELCSFADEDCDGESMAPPTFYRDADGDGYGSASEISVDGCEAPAGFAAQSGDCAVDEPAVNPGADELAGNGVDDNCNGIVDEDGAVPAATNAPAVGTSDPPPTSQDISLDNTAPANGSTGSLPPTATETPPNSDASRGGCGVGRAGTSGMGVSLVGLCCGLWLRRRRW